jgi:hypothetical protein
MVMDAMRNNECNVSQCPIIEEEPNADAARFFDLLKDSDEPLWDGCTNHNKLSAVAQVFTIKSDHGLSEAGYDKIIEWVRSILPEGNRLKESFYAMKSMMKPLGLGYQKIDESRVAKPRASFVLEKNAQLLVYKWLKSLHFLDGHASNISRLVNMEECRLYGMKSHDCHVFMQTLIPLAFRI